MTGDVPIDEYSKVTFTGFEGTVSQVFVQDNVFPDAGYAR